MLFSCFPRLARRDVGKLERWTFEGLSVWLTGMMLGSEAQWATSAEWKVTFLPNCFVTFTLNFMHSNTEQARETHGCCEADTK